MYYLCEHIEDISIGVSSRLVINHDAPALCIELLRCKPWERIQKGGQNSYYDGNDWRKKDDDSKISNSEVLLWTSLWYLLQKKTISREIRNSLLSHSIPWKYLIGPIQNKHNNNALLVEQVAEIREDILSFYEGKYVSIAMDQIKNHVEENKQSVLLEESSFILDILNNEAVQELMTGSQSKSCVVCRKPSSRNLCSVCKSVRYCGRECQAKHWPAHKKIFQRRAMVSISGEAFKVCGLCSQLVDTSVDIDEILIDFLSQFLSITPDNFPPKICTDCFSSATEAKRFKEHCIKAIHKIKKTRLCTSVILGKDTVGTSRMISPSRKSEPPPRNSYGILSPRSNNFEKSSLEELQVQIPYTERNEADKKFEEDGCSYLKKKSEKNHSNTSSSFLLHPRDKSPILPLPRVATKKSKGGQGQTPTKARPSSLNSSKDSTELDTAEVFPSIGPYQCEICQKITDTKQEFVQHIKELHRSVVDEEDKMKKVKEEELDPPAEQKNTSLPNNQSTSDGKKPSNNSLSCPRCSAVLSNVYSMKKHQKTKSCRNFVKNTQDINAERFRDDCLESRTCIYCSKVVSRIRDLESHHASKYCSSIRADKEKEFKSKEAVIEKSTNSSSLKENGSLEKRGNTSSISSSNASDYNAKETAATSSSPSQENESMIPSEHEKDDDKISLNNNNNNTQEAKSIETPASDENGSQRSSSKTEGQESTVSDNVDVINS
ncbi:unnamed protein product [Lepeophtheirus salmonis]|uniref:(salmon louse) hypothetical protein n=1 Tax=Lepeophtheirus salmonis TaxID=72036 RepID=A0A7R8H042_LEPSM|nr:unnamed protein product [Lepeophtheirus salmonis]CAF2777228.1 unnamed protein product [Lepeophtheirus salmonis]